MTLELWDHQREAVEAWRESGCERGQIVHFCGTGKTLTSWSAVEGEQFVVVACPTVTLLRQTRERWNAFGDGRAQSLEIHSYRGGVLCVDELIDVMNRSESLTIYVSHASLPTLQEAMGVAAKVADVLIVDEAHKIAGEASDRREAALFGLPARRRLFLTATPRIHTKTESGMDIAVSSMDDPHRFGRVLHSFTYGEALTSATAMVAPFEVAAAVAEVEGEITPTVRRSAAQGACLQLFQKKGLRRGVSFHATIESAEQFARSLHGTGIAGFHTSGKDDGDDQREVLEAFEACDGPAILTNARLFTEGVDIPSVDCVVFADKKSSVVEIVQCVGRALRSDPDNPEKTASIVLPLIIGSEAYETTTFRDVLLAMQSLSPDLQSEILAARKTSELDWVSIDWPASLHGEIVGDVESVIVDKSKVSNRRPKFCEQVERVGKYLHEQGHLPFAGEDEWLDDVEKHLTRAGWGGYSEVKRELLRSIGVFPKFYRPRKFSEQHARFIRVRSSEFDGIVLAPGHPELVAFSDDDKPRTIWHTVVEVRDWVAASRSIAETAWYFQRHKTKTTELDGLASALKMDKRAVDNLVTHDGYVIGGYVRSLQCARDADRLICVAGIEHVLRAKKGDKLLVGGLGLGDIFDLGRVSDWLPADIVDPITGQLIENADEVGESR